MTRAEQKSFLRTVYADYDPTRHDAFVWRYQAEQEALALHAYEKREGHRATRYPPSRKSTFL